MEPNSILGERCSEEFSKLFVNPPAGWFVFGTHVEKDSAPNGLEFYGEEYSNDSLPLWERPL